MDIRAPGRQVLPTRFLASLLLAALVAGCATHGGGGASGRDGSEAHPPADLDKIPDAVPKVESIRIGGPNKPYEVDGRTYVPITDDRPLVQKGLASWYGKKFHGRRTSSGEAYNMYAMTAAHPTLPIPSYARVRNPANGREVIVRVNDRGPFSPGRIIDLSYTAALKLGVLGGVAPVEVERITDDAIRSGAAFKAPQNAVAKAPPPAPTFLPAPAPVPVPVPVPVAVPAPAPTLAPEPAAASAADGPVARDDSPPAPRIALPDSPPVVSLASPSASPPPDETTRAFTPAAVGFWVQLGAYRQRDGALGFQKQVAEQEPWLAPLLAVYSDRGLHKLQAGPYPTKEEARSAAERIRLALQLVPTIIEKR